MPPGALPWLALGSIILVLVACIGVALFWMALSRATTPAARSAAIRGFAAAAIPFGLFVAWVGWSVAELLVLLNDPDRGPDAVGEFLFARVFCMLWLCL